jgi:hypothetical protein
MAKKVSEFSYNQLERLERLSDMNEKGEATNVTLLTHAKVGQSVASLTHANVKAAKFETAAAIATV